MDGYASVGHRFLDFSIGTQIEIISNDYKEMPISDDENSTYQQIVFQIKEEDPDSLAIGILFTLSLMSFTFSAPRGISEEFFNPDEEWNLEYFLEGLEYKDKCLYFSADYISGRMMKTNITFEPGGRVTIRTTNRSRGAERWLTHLQGKKHIQQVK